MKIQVLKGVGGVCFGDRRISIAKKYGKRYREFDKNQCPTNLAGIIDDHLCVYYDPQDRVDFFDVAEPTCLVDKTGTTIPLVYRTFMEWATEHTFRLECDMVYIPSMSLVVTFQMLDDGTLPDSAIAIIASIGIPEYFDENYFDPLNKHS